MARKGGEPKITEYGKNTRFGSKRGYSAVKAAKKANESRAENLLLCGDLKERLTPERIAKMNERLITMAEHGNIAAWEKIRDSIGEKPANKMELSGSVSNPSERFASFSDDELRQAIEALQKKSEQE